MQYQALKGDQSWFPLLGTILGEKPWKHWISEFSSAVLYLTEAPKRGAELPARAKGNSGEAAVHIAIDSELALASGLKFIGEGACPA